MNSGSSRDFAAILGFATWMAMLSLRNPATAALPDAEWLDMNDADHEKMSKDEEKTRTISMENRVRVSI